MVRVRSRGDTSRPSPNVARLPRRASSIDVDARVTSLDRPGTRKRPHRSSASRRSRLFSDCVALFRQAAVVYESELSAKQESAQPQPRYCSRVRNPPVSSRRRALLSTRFDSRTSGRAGHTVDLVLSPEAGFLLLPRSDRAAAHGRAQHRAVADRPQGLSRPGWPGLRLPP
jgi:hypothetical protein